MLNRLSSSLIFLFLAACANTDSENISTSSFCARYTATTTGSTTSVVVYWQVGCGIGGSYIELSDSDSVSISVNNGIASSMTKSSNSGVVTYYASVSGGAGDQITVTLDREGEGAYLANVTLPSELSISSPTSSFTQAKGSSLNVSWTGTNGNLDPNVNLRASYSTASGSAGSTTASSSISSSGASFSSTQTSFADAVGDVTATIEVFNNTEGNINNSFEGGYFYGKYKSSVSGTLN